MLRTRTEANKTLNFHQILICFWGDWQGHLRPSYLVSLRLNGMSVLTGGACSDSQEARVMVKLMYSNLLVATVPLFLSTSLFVVVCFDMTVCVWFVCAYSWLYMYCCNLIRWVSGHHEFWTLKQERYVFALQTLEVLGTETTSKKRP